MQPATEYVPATADPKKMGGRCSDNYIMPNAMAIHNVNTNANTPVAQIQAVREDATEISTLVSFSIPAWTANMTCKTGIAANRLGVGDDLRGAQTVDIFSTLLTDIRNTPSGNQRNKHLARLRFNSTTKLFDFDVNTVTPQIQEFPAPAGVTLQWEIVAVGFPDRVLIGQDFAQGGWAKPNGIFIEIQ
ncbi:endonuclease/reverse transcriptase [Purpureocillium lavendulum]|uniref:Endonuclease/reverse transcriptase n=1 Tax=Purpureocillium lavendulum TaxID=1247861 RepID=A0AB34FJQ7_9HYPO|nr:endonuclease/reverse transcriptase [Purpureocillium lavendulum]